MNTNPQKELQDHRDSLDLDGLESLLDHAHLELAKPEALPTAELKLIQNLLEQLCRVTELVKDTGERLAGANERLNSLGVLVSTQGKQMELLEHYQTQAARTVSLEHQLAAAQAELEHLRRPLIKKLTFWVK